MQGLQHYRQGANDLTGLMHAEIGGYRPGDIHVVAAWDVDRRKVGRDVAEAIFAKPNCTAVFCARGASRPAPIVAMGPVLDGVAEHMADYPQATAPSCSPRRPSRTGRRRRGAARERTPTC